MTIDFPVTTLLVLILFSLLWIGHQLQLLNIAADVQVEAADDTITYLKSIDDNTMEK